MFFDNVGYFRATPGTVGDRLSHNFRFRLSYLDRSLNHSRFGFWGGRPGFHRRLRKKCTFLDLLNSAARRFSQIRQQAPA